MNNLNSIQTSLNALLSAVQAKPASAVASSDHLAEKLAASLKSFEAELAALLNPPNAGNDAVSQGKLVADTAPAPSSLPQVPAPISASSTERVTTWLAPGEAGAGLPQNYLHSPLYQAWVAQQPSLEGMSVAEYGKALETWQKANPYYINPQDHQTFDAYATAVGQATSSGNGIGQQNAARNESLLTSYFGAAAVANPWVNTPPGIAAEGQAALENENVNSLHQRTTQTNLSRLNLARLNLNQL